MDGLSKRKRAAPPAREKRGAGSVALWLNDGDICCAGYTRLSDNPEIQTACLRIAELIASMTIYLMENNESGDRRIQNELSRMIDITPNGNMTRTQWMTAIVMNMLLYGDGNSVVLPRTRDGYLRSLEPVSPQRVSFYPMPGSFTDYRIMIDGRAHDPEQLMHFVYNPDPLYPWRGRGVTVTLKDVANNLKQAQKTENAFMSSEWKPSIIVKVDGLTEEFYSPEGRQKLLESYIHPPYPGAPWMIPAEAFNVEQVKPLSLSDLAINDTVKLDRQLVASVLGVPAFVVGVGEFRRDEWNNFVQTKLRAIALIIQQEMTRALIVSPKWYLRLNYWNLMDYNLAEMSQIMLAGADRGFVSGDEWRDRLNMQPAGLTEFRILENYIDYEDVSKQKKLVQNES